ncbi:hypothetical protein [Terrimonas pollutisoli]|uniref:hypothetical protein n=1 Tax=Terrimonas pollutisoli TaxID=3034147 RepID=UPI0023EB40D7|nr:hypothetical protein [Terrimonas sp. H1YJ31]
MQHFLLFVLFIATLSSCTTYQYVTLDSSDVPKNEKKEFLWENDTLKVSYKFSGEGGLLTIAVFNKANQPLYIKWKKSALINDGEAMSLFKKGVIVSGAVETDTYRVDKNLSASSSFFSASFDLPEGVDFLPPLSGLSKSLVSLQEINSKSMAVPGDVPQKKIKSAEGIITKLRLVQYGKELSPLKFKIYLTLALGQEAGSEFFVQHSFYANEVIQTNEMPDLFSMYRKDGSQFYVRHEAQ